MTFPINIDLFGKEISTHFVCELVGIFIGVRYYLFLKNNYDDPISKIHRLYIFAAVCLGALVGSRLVGVFEDPYQFYNSDDKFKYIFSNKTIVGGLVGGLFAVEGIKIILKIKASSGDIMVFPILLGLIIGRVGCFCEGLADGTIGRPTTGIFGINFGDNILRHPLPLYEIAFLIILWGGIYILDHNIKLANGAKFKIFMVSYLIYRFFNEFLKESHFLLFGLNVIQITVLIGIIYYYKLFIFPKSLILTNART